MSSCDKNCLAFHHLEPCDEYHYPMRNIGGEDLMKSGVTWILQDSGIYVPDPYQLHTSTVNKIKNQKAQEGL